MNTDLRVAVPSTATAGSEGLDRRDFRPAMTALDGSG